MTRQWILRLGLLLSVFAFLALLSFFSSAQHSPVESEEEWKAIIRAEGGRAAYIKLEKQVERLEESKKHTQAHFFGGALYATEGLKALSVCDQQFSYGCFHEFLGRAIAELGISSVPELNRKCFEALDGNGLSCQHGIGHGVQAFFGYSGEDLLRALDTCSKAAGIDPIGGCYSGVFMEYNFQTTLGEQAVMRVSDDMASPCHAVAESYKESCLFSQPQWWYQNSFAPKSNSEVFASLGARCDSVAQTSRELEQCYRGIGNIAPQVADYLPKRAAELCIHASESAREQLGCLSTAANSIGVTLSAREGERVCSSLSDDALLYCLSYARNEANALFERALPQSL